MLTNKNMTNSRPKQFNMLFDTLDNLQDCNLRIPNIILLPTCLLYILFTTTTKPCPLSGVGLPGRILIFLMKAKLNLMGQLLVFH